MSVVIKLIDVNVDFEVMLRETRRRASRVTVSGLRDVNLEIHRGQAVGVVGFNGAGKSTLVRTMAGVYTPTSGEVLVSATPQLLSIGTAVKRRLSGRDNIRLGCLALGAHPSEIESLERDVLEFAEIEEFADMPLRTYSSGMRARLNFGVATSVNPEILLLDEAFAVGDHRFREKSNARLSSLKEHAGTVVMVSHQLGHVVDNCDRVIWIDDGQVRHDGPPDEVVASFREAGGTGGKGGRTRRQRRRRGVGKRRGQGRGTSTGRAGADRAEH